MNKKITADSYDLSFVLTILARIRRRKRFDNLKRITCPIVLISLSSYWVICPKHPTGISFHRFRKISRRGCF